MINTHKIPESKKTYLNILREITIKNAEISHMSMVQCAFYAKKIKSQNKNIKRFSNKAYLKTMIIY